MTDGQRHLSALTLDRRALGDLSAEDSQAMDLHLADCELCRGRLSAQRESFQKFEQYVLPAVLPVLTARRRSYAWQLAWGVPIAASLALAILLLPRAVPRPQAALQDEVSVKGGPNFQTFVKRGTQVFAAADGVLLMPGDALRFVVQSAGLPYLLIVSRDGAGHLTVYYPFGGTHSAELKSEGRNELPGSVELDATPGEERLLALFSRRPLEASRVISQLADSATEPSATALGADALLHLRFVKPGASNWVSLPVKTPSETP
jgi:hypothetical protein